MEIILLKTIYCTLNWSNEECRSFCLRMNSSWSGKVFSIFVGRWFPSFLCTLKRWKPPSHKNGKHLSTWTWIHSKKESTWHSIRAKREVKALGTTLLHRFVTAASASEAAIWGCSQCVLSRRKWGELPCRGPKGQEGESWSCLRASILLTKRCHRNHSRFPPSFLEESVKSQIFYWWKWCSIGF